MAAGTLPIPGTEYGPCLDQCDHVDCAQIRAMADAICPMCRQPIGYDRRFMANPSFDHQQAIRENRLLHYVCYTRYRSHWPNGGIAQ